MRQASAALAASAVFAAVLAWGCGGPADPEAKLRRLLEELESAVEARELGELKDAIAEDFRDEGGRDKRELTRYLAGLLLRNENIHLATRVRELTIDPAGGGQVEMIAALASGPLASASDLARLRGDVYRFDLSFVDRDGDWSLRGARWRPAVVADLFP